MPIYEFRCRKCDHPFEELLSLSRSKDPVPCPRCGKKDTERLLSSFAASTGAGPSASGAASDDSCACGRTTRAGCRTGG